MDALERIAEQRIEQALAAGELDTPLAGRPIALDDLSNVPEELRMAYHVLHNANCLPPEMELQRERVRLQDLLAACDDATARAEIEKKLAAQTLRYELLMERRRPNGALTDYRAAIVRRLGGSS